MIEARPLASSVVLDVGGSASGIRGPAGATRGQVWDLSFPTPTKPWQDDLDAGSAARAAVHRAAQGWRGNDVTPPNLVCRRPPHVDEPHRLGGVYMQFGALSFCQGPSCRSRFQCRKLLRPGETPRFQPPTRACRHNTNDSRLHIASWIHHAALLGRHRGHFRRWQATGERHHVGTPQLCRHRYCVRAARHRLSSGGPRLEARAAWRSCGLVDQRPSPSQSPDKDEAARGASHRRRHEQVIAIAVVDHQRLAGHPSGQRMADADVVIEARRAAPDVTCVKRRVSP